MRAQRDKKESWKESLHFLREYINSHEKNVCRNMNIKGHSGEVSERNEEQLLKNGEKAIPVIKWQRTWLNCVLMFCGR